MALADILSALGIGGGQQQGLQETNLPGGTTPLPPMQSQSQASPSSSAPGAPTGIEGLLSNPLLQGALGAYLGTIRSTGGLTGLEFFNQAEQEKQALPYMAARTQEQQAVAQQAGLQTQLTKRQMQPLTPQMLQKLDQYKNAATDPKERGYLDMLEAQAQQGLISPQDLDKYIESYDESKRLLEFYKGQQAQATAQFLPQMMNMFPGMGGAVPSMPSMGGTAPAGAPPGLSGGATPGTVFQANVSGKTVPAVQDPGDGKYYYLDGGKWQPMP
jgi:hypothetical protein